MDDGDYPITSLVDAAAAGDERAWHEIVDRCTPLLGGVIRRYRRIATETQDVAQTVWLRPVEHLSGLWELRALPMWIITTDRRESLRCLSDRRRTVLYDAYSSWPPFPAEDPGPEAELLWADRLEALLAGQAELPARQRELLLLLAADLHLSYAQISERTGIPPAAGPWTGSGRPLLSEITYPRTREVPVAPDRPPASTAPWSAARADRGRGERHDAAPLG